MMMRNITLPTGPYDWHPERVSRAIYDARLAAFRGALQAHGLAGGIVSGSTFDDGALVWVTGFTPKLGPAFAIVPAAGEPRLLFSGGASMRPSAQKLTWFADVKALRGLATELAELRVAGAGTWGLAEDAGLTWDNRCAIIAAFGGEPVDITPAVDHLRRAHEPEVLPLIRCAGTVMRQVESALLNSAAARGTRWAMRLATERAAQAAGAQDIRMRLARRDFGPAEPVDPDDSVLPACASVALAVRVEGYWLCGRSWLGSPAPALRSVWERLAPRLSAGSTPASFAQVVAPARIEIFAVGHSLVERVLAAGEPLSPAQCVGITLATDAAGETGLSAVVEIGTGGARVLWIAALLQPMEQVR
jgi:hypothetical protein